MVDDPSAVSRFRKSVRKLGLAETLRVAPKPMVDSLFHRFLSPTLYELATALPNSFFDAPGFVASLGRAPTEAVGTYLAEYAELRQALSRRYDAVRLSYPAHWKLESSTTLAVYLLVRAMQPLEVLETGVANGESTFYLLNAMQRNQRGRLTSVDVSNDVGGLVSDDLRSRWNLHILDRPLPRSLREVISTLGPVDLSLHDSGHDYRWQSLEYEVASARVRAGGVLLSDDIDTSFAFTDFVRRHRLTGCALIGRLKVVGGVRL